MSKIVYPSMEKLRYLLESIHNREVALPDFQRDFVWEASATEELLISLCQNFPAGSLLRIRSSNEGVFFAPREIQGAPALNGQKPSYLILDGQQRLTSLYRALYGVGPHRFYLDFEKLLGGADLEDALFYERERRSRRSSEGGSLTFPLANILAADGFDGWLDQVTEDRGENNGASPGLRKLLRDARLHFLRPLEEYEFPVITLAEETSPAAVCTIFETLNRTGVKLSAFDLLGARFWPQEIHLRDWFEQAKRDFRILADFSVEPYYILQAVALLEARAAASCKKSDVLDLSAKQMTQGWLRAVKGIADFLSIIAEDCGVLTARWLPYAPMVVSGGAILATLSGSKGPQAAANREYLVRWFWNCVFSQAYENAPNSQAARDYADVGRWLTNDNALDSLTRVSLEDVALSKTTPKQRAVYRGIIGLIVANGARDFHTGKPLSAKLIAEEEIDDHHVFPRNYLERVVTDLDPTERDCVLNRTLLDRATNIRISNRAPDDYLGEMASTMGAEKLDQILDSHLLPRHGDTSWSSFSSFLTKRNTLLKDAVSHATAGLKQ